MHARNFKGPDKWIPVTVTRITSPVSYRVQTSDTIQPCRVNQLCYRHSFDCDNQESNDFDDWPFSYTTSTTDELSNLEQGHGQLEVGSPPLFRISIEPGNQLIFMDLTFQSRREGML